MKPFEVVDVTDWPSVGGEPMGSKRKVWLSDPDGGRGLFKAPRETSGDDWAEKITAELGAAIGPPCPRVELARVGVQRGSITRSFLPNTASGAVRLVHGNEILWKLNPSYPKAERRRVRQHTVDAVMDCLETYPVQPPDGRHRHSDGHVLTACDCFAGYLAFDAWIGNQDRHHENWGVLLVPLFELSHERLLSLRLAPSFDHAASLGQVLADEERSGRLDARDSGYAIGTWARKACSHLYVSPEGRRPATTFAAFEHAAHRYPAAAEFWRQRIANVKMADVEAIVRSVPEERMSELARRFAIRLLETDCGILQAPDLR